MLIKLSGLKLKKGQKKVLKSFFILFLVSAWLLTGYPAISIPGFGIFPPKIKEIRAATVNVLPNGQTGDTSGDLLSDITSDNATCNPDTLSAVSSGDTCYTIDKGAIMLLNSFDTSAIPNGSIVTGAVLHLQYGAENGYAPTTAYVRYNNGSGLTNTTINPTDITGWSADLTYDLYAQGVDTLSEVQNVDIEFASSDTGGADAVHFDYVWITVTYSTATTISNFVTAEPSSSTAAPGASAQLDSFGLQTSFGTDTVTGATVTLAAGTGTRVATVAIINDGDTTTYCSAAPSGDTATLSTCGIPVSTTNAQFKVKITAISHTSMPAPPGAEYVITGTVTSFTSTNAQAGTDSGSATVTIDNLSPNGATLTSGTAGNAAVTLNWTTSNSGDFDATNGSVILRWASGTAGGEVPAEGNSSYVAGNTITTATVACVISSSGSTAQSKVDGTGGSAGCTTSALTNGQAYTYKVFQRDTNGNYDAGVSIGTFTPSAASATFTQNKYLWYVDNDLADPTAIWGNPDLIENQAIVVIPSGNDPPDTAQELRLRVNYVVNTAGISISEKYFKLEYKAGTDGTCTTGSWTDVGTGDWVYATSGVTDGADIIKVLSDTTTGKGEEYVKGKPSQVNHVAASAAEIIEYDFHIVGTNATANTQYSFRVVETNNLGTTEVVFDGYTSCPTLTTEPGMANLLRHGNVFTEGIEKGFFWN